MPNLNQPNKRYTQQEAPQNSLGDFDEIGISSIVRRAITVARSQIVDDAPSSLAELSASVKR